MRNPSGLHMPEKFTETIQSCLNRHTSQSSRWNGEARNRFVPLATRQGVCNVFQLHTRLASKSSFAGVAPTTGTTYAPGMFQFAGSGSGSGGGADLCLRKRSSGFGRMEASTGGSSVDTAGGSGRSGLASLGGSPSVEAT
jgi:hypothetical protein